MPIQELGAKLGPSQRDNFVSSKGIVQNENLSLSFALWGEKNG
jgi:hypothetical protein